MGLPESFEVDGWVVKVSGHSRDILFKNAIHKEMPSREPADTNQVGGNFHWQSASFDITESKIGHAKSVGFWFYSAF